jgi:hypothetical protein
MLGAQRRNNDLVIFLMSLSVAAILVRTTPAKSYTE